MAQVRRCPCGSYCVQHAAKIGHTCSAGDHPVRHGSPASHAKYEEMVKMRAAGRTLRYIGYHYGITYQAVQQFLAYHLRALRGGHSITNANTADPISEEQALTLRGMLDYLAPTPKWYTQFWAWVAAPENKVEAIQRSSYQRVHDDLAGGCSARWRQGAERKKWHR